MTVAGGLPSIAVSLGLKELPTLNKSDLYIRISYNNYFYYLSFIYLFIFLFTCLFIYLMCVCVRVCVRAY